MRDRYMYPSYQVRFSVILKLGHTRRNKWRIVTTATDRRRGTVVWLMRYTRPDPAEPFFKIRTFKPTNPSFLPHYFIIPLISPLFSTSTLSQPPIISLSQFFKDLKCDLLVETAAVSVYLSTEYFCICFSPFLFYVSLIYTHLCCIFVFI